VCFFCTSLHLDTLTFPRPSQVPAVRVEVWLEVIPQLIARIDHHSPHVQRLLNKLLARAAAAHPQALIYPLAVTSNTASEARRVAAHVIIR